jgi:uncharacterized protein YcsI (UPF0317 family)
MNAVADREDLMSRVPLAEIRKHIREGRFQDQTGSLAPGKLQGNIVILPADEALHFSTYCQRNPRPCPLVGVSDIGDPRLPALGEIDIRTDVPRYNVYEHGELTAQVTDLRERWREDFVTFVLGCSFSFEKALVDAGIPLRHLKMKAMPAVFVSDIKTADAGPFGGPMVVSMRPFTVPDAIKAIEISGRFPHAHGSPVHFGDARAIGIADVQNPDWGPPTPVLPGEVPLFWACGVTPQMAIRKARPPICITHAPGSMLITDIDA